MVAGLNILQPLNSEMVIVISTNVIRDTVILESIVLKTIILETKVPDAMALNADVFDLRFCNTMAFTVVSLIAE